MATPALLSCKLLSAGHVVMRYNALGIGMFAKTMAALVFAGAWMRTPAEVFTLRSSHGKLVSLLP